MSSDYGYGEMRRVIEVCCGLCHRREQLSEDLMRFAKEEALSKGWVLNPRYKWVCATCADNLKKRYW